jgi:hypothetical protein
LVKKTFQGFGFTVFADKNHPAADIIQDHGQVAVTLFDRDFIHGQNTQPL